MAAGDEVDVHLLRGDVAMLEEVERATGFDQEEVAVPDERKNLRDGAGLKKDGSDKTVAGLRKGVR